jgi:hypothetical protein
MGFSECDRKTSLGPKSHISVRRAFVPDPSMPGYEWSLEHIEEVCHFPQEPNDRGDAASQAINYFRAHADGFGDWLKAAKEKTDAEKLATAIPQNSIKFGHLSAI